MNHQDYTEDFRALKEIKGVTKRIDILRSLVSANDRFKDDLAFLNDVYDNDAIKDFAKDYLRIELIND